jgi:hypothetical protein
LFGQQSRNVYADFRCNRLIQEAVAPSWQSKAAPRKRRLRRPPRPGAAGEPGLAQHSRPDAAEVALPLLWRVRTTRAHRVPKEFQALDAKPAFVLLVDTQALVFAYG